MTPEALHLLVEAGLDGMNVDVKGNAPTVHRYCQRVDVEQVWRNCRLAHDLDVHVEITTLVIPSVNDADEVLAGIVGRIVFELGADVPWHVSGYHSAYLFTAPPTPVHTLERAWHIGKEAGLEFGYLGNVLGHPLENIHCPACSAPLIERWGQGVTAYRLESGHCPECAREIVGGGRNPRCAIRAVRCTAVLSNGFTVFGRREAQKWRKGLAASHISTAASA